MQIEFSAQEKRHLTAIFDDILTHEELRPNRNFRKTALYYKNKFNGSNSIVSLKLRHIAELYNLASSSLDVLNRTRKSGTLPGENQQDVIDYIVIVAQLIEKLKNTVLRSNQYVLNEQSKLPNEK